MLDSGASCHLISEKDIVPGTRRQVDGSRVSSRRSFSALRWPVCRFRRAFTELQQSGYMWHELADPTARHHVWLQVHDLADDSYFKHDSCGHPLALYVDDRIFGLPKWSIHEEAQWLSRPHVQEKDCTLIRGGLGPLDQFPSTYYHMALCPGRGLLRAQRVLRRTHEVQKPPREAEASPFAIANREGALPPPADYESPGEYQVMCGALLWIVRCVAPDSAYDVSLTGCFFPSWCEAADKMLLNIFGYHGSLEPCRIPPDCGR